MDRSALWLASSIRQFRQTPVNLAFAVTIHTCQGWTKPSVSVDSGTKEFALGLTFVAADQLHWAESCWNPPTQPVPSGPVSNTYITVMDKRNDEILINYFFAHTYQLKFSFLLIMAFSATYNI
jgi:hypothetical protein